MTIILFLIILAVLILSHELGHFLAAKKFGIRVDEFGLGFPPKAVGFKRGETEYTLNWIPFGGFVKIFGETPDEESISGPDAARSMIHKPKWQQAVVLAAGVFFNLVLAWLLIAIGFVVGLPAPASEVAQTARSAEARLLLTQVLPESPAALAGLVSGDELVSLRAGRDALLTGLSAVSVQNFVSSHAQEEIKIEYRRGRVFADNEIPVQQVTVRPQEGVIDGRPAIGVSMDLITIKQLPLHRAVWEGLILTGGLVRATTAALAGFVADAFRGNEVLENITGPVGLVGLVGNARDLGLVYLLSFTALISINLAVINLVPFPALDGGRLLFLLIEKIKGSPIKPTVANWLNLVGFALLILLMLVVTYNDIAKLL